MTAGGGIGRAVTGDDNHLTTARTSSPPPPAGSSAAGAPLAGVACTTSAGERSVVAGGDIGEAITGDGNHA
ncbi:hypothetical protein GCM10027168_63630 [Streptomyces capparidis]